MNRLAIQRIAPVAIGSILVLPFLILEIVNRPAALKDFPVPLFALLWFLPVAILSGLIAVVRISRTEFRLGSILQLLFLLVLLALAAAWWVGLIWDQMPCFLGVPNCD